jgi:hypothetical protein
MLNSRASIPRPQYVQHRGDSVPQQWNNSRAVYLQRFNELLAISIQVSQSDYSQVLRTILRHLMECLMEILAAQGDVAVERRKEASLEQGATATLSEIWRIARWRKGSWDRPNGIDYYAHYCPVLFLDGQALIYLVYGDTQFTVQQPR